MPTGRTRLKAVHEFRDAWRWPEDVERFVRERCETPTLHVCAGDSTLGDVTVDAACERNPDVVGDMTQLPFPDRTFNTVICDPPWRSVDVFDRHTLFYELCRVTRLKGWIIHNTTWVPESDQCEKRGEYRRQDRSFGDASIITVFERYPGQTTLPTDDAENKP